MNLRNWNSTKLRSIYTQANPPDPSKILDQDVIGVTVILLTCSYKDREFIRVGYYVNNDYADGEMKENPPAKPVISQVSVYSLFTIIFFRESNVFH